MKEKRLFKVYDLTSTAEPYLVYASSPIGALEVATVLHYGAFVLNITAHVTVGQYSIAYRNLCVRKK